MPAYSVGVAQVPFQNAHNDYAQLLLEFGLVGFFLLLLFLGLIVLQLWRSSRGKNAAASYSVLMILIYLAIHSATDANLQIPAFVFTLMAILATPYIQLESSRKKRKMRTV